MVESGWGGERSERVEERERVLRCSGSLGAVAGE